MAEVKVSVDSVKLGQTDQFQTYINYPDLTKQRMWTSVVLFVGLKRTSDKKEKNIAKRAAKKGVLGLVVDFGL
ncbi:MAG: hypothetical protein SVX43_17620 [Cyanobacteriota bacterium]|nr:hypothetical protein [Cyanobacteriota bacterium]